ncbi:MAG: DinB family protein [Bacteroidetes bacterium]|nr:DinB family protein [Bacteroidota bacterium]
MNPTAIQLQKIVADYSPQLRKINEEDYSAKPNPKKWSRKEILGHLIDSAQSNIRRFVVAQYEDVPKIVYNQDAWVTISNYQHYPTQDIIELWALLNKHICQILSIASPELLQRKCATNSPEPHTIKWLAEDYVKHLLHHLHQILNLDSIAYP